MLVKTKWKLVAQEVPGTFVKVLTDLVSGKSVSAKFYTNTKVCVCVCVCVCACDILLRKQ